MKKKLKIAEPFENSIEKLENLIVRIDSRISKMEDNNIDTQESKILQEKAKRIYLMQKKNLQI